MNIDDVRAWWEENLVTVELHQDVRELVVQKIISTYAAGIFAGAKAARAALRKGEGRPLHNVPAGYDK